MGSVFFFSQNMLWYCNSGKWKLKPQKTKWQISGDYSVSFSRSLVKWRQRVREAAIKTLSYKCIISYCRRKFEISIKFNNRVMIKKNKWNVYLAVDNHAFTKVKDDFGILLCEDTRERLNISVRFFLPGNASGSFDLPCFPPMCTDRIFQLEIISRLLKYFQFLSVRSFSGIYVLYPEISHSVTLVLQTELDCHSGTKMSPHVQRKHKGCRVSWFGSS